MGMDVYGKNPRGYIDDEEDDAKSGVYFRANIWWWGPLWGFIEDTYPEIARKVEYAYSNDGDGLGAKDSKHLSKMIKRDLDNGFVDKYIANYTAVREAIPDERCEYCDGSGKRDDEVGQSLRELDPKFTCNACEGKGSHRPLGASVCIDRKTIEEFAEFLENCGGFAIC